MMLKQLLAVFILLTLCNSCKPQKGNHLPQQQMVSLLYDISVAETYSTMAKDNSHAAGMKNTDSLAQYYQQVFEHHHITQAEFKSNMNWYKEHPEEMDSVYSKVSALADKYLEEENKKVKPVVPTPAK